MKVYKYGCDLSHEQEAIVFAQMDAATEYRRELVIIELQRREAVAGAEAEYMPRLGRLREEIAAYEAYMAESHEEEDKTTRKAVVVQLAALREQAKPLEHQLIKERDIAQRDWDAALALMCLEHGSDGPRTRERFASELEPVACTDDGLSTLWRASFAHNREANRRVKAARAAKRCCSGTSLLVEQDVQAAKQTPIGFGKHQQVTRVAVKMAPPIQTVDVVRGAAAHCKILPRPAGERQAGKKGAPLKDFALRLGASPEVRVTGTLVYHRPLPEDGQVVLIQLVRLRTNRRIKWSLQFTMATSHELHTRGAEGCAAVALTWRQDGDDIVHGVVATEHGSRELRLPGVWADEQHADKLLGIFDEHVTNGVALLADMAEQSDAATHRWVDGRRALIPVSTLVSELGRLGARILPMQIADALTRNLKFDWAGWKRERLDAKLDLYAPLNEVAAWLGTSLDDARPVWACIWLIKARHLWDWYAGKRARVARRRAQYAQLNALSVYETNARVAIDGRDASTVARKLAGTPSGAKRHKSAAATLRAKLKEMFREHAREATSEGTPEEIASALLAELLSGALDERKAKKKGRMKQRKHRRESHIARDLRGARKASENPAE